jgi:hypothetical protein
MNAEWFAALRKICEAESRRRREGAAWMLPHDTQFDLSEADANYLSVAGNALPALVAVVSKLLAELRDDEKELAALKSRHCGDCEDYDAEEELCLGACLTPRTPADWGGCCAWHKREEAES